MGHTEPPVAAMLENCVVIRWGRRQGLFSFALPLCNETFHSGTPCMIMLMVSYLLFYLSRDSVFVNKWLSQHWWPLSPSSADCQSDNVAYSPGPHDSVFVNKALSHWWPLSPSSADCQSSGFWSLCFYRLQTKFAKVMFHKRLSFCPQGRCACRGSASRGGVGQTSLRMLCDTVNELALCILVECILIVSSFLAGVWDIPILLYDAVVDPRFSWAVANYQSRCTNLLFCKSFAKNCMKMKEFGFWGGYTSPGAPFGVANG